MRREAGGISYELAYKKVKNLNLRVRPDGTLWVSAPRRVGVREIDRFVSSRADWIEKAREKMRRRPPREPAPADPPDDQTCLAVFMPLVEQWRLVLAEWIPQTPQIRIRYMKSCWGVCHPRKGYITLNSRLVYEPPAAIEYVVLHELVHFLHPNHQAGFHATMAKLMPDYQARRALLRHGKDGGTGKSVVD